MLRAAPRNLVEAPGIEPPATGLPRVANSRESDAKDATKDDAKRREVSASDARNLVIPADVDEAIRTAAKVAIDAGDYRRARALVDLLEASARVDSERPAKLLRLR